MAANSSTKSSTTRLIEIHCFSNFLDKSPIVEVAEATHGDDCHCIGMQSWLTGPGRPDQGLHTRLAASPAYRQTFVSIHASKSQFSSPPPITISMICPRNLGPTKFVPGSHFSGCSPNGATEWNNRTEESILCNAGDVVLFRSEVWHRGSANTTDETRYLLQVHFAKRMITQKYPPYLNKFQFDESILDSSEPSTETAPSATIDPVIMIERHMFSIT